MKCDDFVASYSTGSMIARTRARLHARRCAKCAATRDWLHQLRDQLSTPAELSNDLRRVWQRAALVESPEPVRRWVAAPQLAMAGGLAIAAAIIVALFLSIPHKDKATERDLASNNQQPRTPLVVSNPLRVSPDQIVDLETRLNQIATELDRLTEEAAKLEARRVLSDLAATYQPLTAPDST